MRQMQIDVEGKADQKDLAKLEDTVAYDYTATEHIDRMRKELEHSIDTLANRIDASAPARELSSLGSKMEKMFQKQSEKLATIRDCQRDKNELQKQIDKVANEQDKMKK